MRTMSYERIVPTDEDWPAYCITNSAWHYSIYDTVWNKEAMHSLSLKLKVYHRRSGEDQLPIFLNIIGEAENATSNEEALREAKDAIVRQLEGKEQNGWTLSGVWIDRMGGNPELYLFMEFVNQKNHQKIADFERKYEGIYSEDRMRQEIEKLPPSNLGFIVSTRRLEFIGIVQVESCDDGPYLNRYDFKLSGDEVTVTEYAAELNQKIERQITFTVDQTNKYNLIAKVIEFR